MSNYVLDFLPPKMDVTLDEINLAGLYDIAVYIHEGSLWVTQGGADGAVNLVELPVDQAERLANAILSCAARYSKRNKLN